MHPAALHQQAHAALVGNAHAHAGVLHRAGKASVLCVFKVLAYGFQGLDKPCAVVDNLAVGQRLPGPDGVAVADFPGGDAELVRHLVQQGFDGKAGLRYAKAAEGACGRVVRVVGVAVDFKILIVVGPRGVRAGPLQHRAAQRGVSAGVRDDLCSDALNDALFVAAQREFHLHGVALGVDDEAFRPGELDLDGALGQEGNERRVVLYGHVLLAAEAAAHELVLHPDLFQRQAEHRRRFKAGVVGALIRGVDQHAVILWQRHRALRLQKGVLRKGRFKGAG